MESLMFISAVFIALGILVLGSFMIWGSHKRVERAIGEVALLSTWPPEKVLTVPSGVNFFFKVVFRRKNVYTGAIIQEIRYYIIPVEKLETKRIPHRSIRQYALLNKFPLNNIRISIIDQETLKEAEKEGKWPIEEVLI